MMSKYVRSNARTIRLSVRVNSHIYDLLKNSSHNSDRSLRSEAKIRLIDSVTRRLDAPVSFRQLLAETGTNVTIDLDPEINNNLLKLARASGRSKEKEINLRLLAHLRKYELFVTSECFKLREN